MTAETAETALPPGPAELRRAMGLFASGVTVITGLDDGEPVGFACQAFASVSLEPPLILFCADHGGRTWPRIRRSGRFCVNVLAEDQTDLCGRFGSRTGRKFDGLDWEPSRWGAPMLPGVLLRVHAEVGDVHVAGDHDVVIGRVLEVEPGTERRPMVFFRGGFGIDGCREVDAPQAVPDPGLWAWADHWG
ncbi:flavin reductase (DIM6/NTAB) family NADH-FMN oxidoreductase RutF [Thermocatellispora tengchongensis]|uniref:Flavin reductase (DIM6/NTAB) family NADH-FMN oxidoreductase RutF n=1 Tax=Thermocatellispora tengchongensis TaxID=1073253 RepID=A0A840PD14_9ACTN|nr:flavin reductase family protein [Thermocatellispora tengchongensis]MBB5136879.1 flavin reductase (DIM6/NTAB) family NADH-FMN oxidoreductase RutF [Thermocatellispora tengchongensis]